MDFYNENIEIINVFILIFASCVNLGLSFLFSLIETSLIITDDLRFQALIAKTKDEKKNRRLSRMLRKRDKYGASLSVAITLTNVTGSSILGSMAAKYLNSTWVVVFTITITYLMLVFARTVPKIYARKVNHDTLLKYTNLVQFIYAICIPILWFTLVWVKILKLNKNSKKPTITELKEIVSVYKKNGVIRSSEENIFSNIFDLREMRVDVFVNPKHKYLSVYEDSTLNQSKEQILNSYYKKMIVKNKEEKIVGIVNDYILIQSLLNNKGDMKISEFTKKVNFVNEFDKIIDAISKLNHKVSQSVIINEDGKAIGVVSLKDMYFYLTGKNNKQKK